MRFTDLVLDSLPWKQKILRVGAVLPPRLRTSFLSRGLCALARRSGDISEVETNMGIDPRLKCSLPLDKGSWIFGLPEHYVGERGALELAAGLGYDAEAVIDIGAHVGYYTYFLAMRLPQTTPIYYFEPDPSLFAIIEKNVFRNGLKNVTGFMEAMGASSQISLFYQNLTDTFSGSLEKSFVGKHVTTEVKVQVRAFDDFARSIAKRNLCVKVDIEGAEQQFVDGAQSEWWRISDLIIEILGPAYDAGFVQRLLQTSGMNAYYVNDYTLHPSEDGTFTYQTQQYNWLFTRKSPATLRDALVGTRLKVLR
jgi:FkbM family methyltransferase